MKEILRKVKFIISFCSSTCFANRCAGRIARDLWYTIKFSPVDIIPPWLSMLVYHPWDDDGLLVAAVS
jgi:hypothetical protein